MSLYSSIEETKDLNNKKFNDVKEQVNLNHKFLLIMSLNKPINENNLFKMIKIIKIFLDFSHPKNFG